MNFRLIKHNFPFSLFILKGGKSPGMQSKGNSLSCVKRGGGGVTSVNCIGSPKLVSAKGHIELTREWSIWFFSSPGILRGVAAGRGGKRLCMILLIAFFVIFASTAFAVPDTASVRITDVTTSSFSVVWLTDVAAEPSVEVYSDGTMKNRITADLALAIMPAGSQKVAAAARAKGIMKVTVSGLAPSTRYYVMTVTKDLSDFQSVGYSTLYEVQTASMVKIYSSVNGRIQGFSNDLLTFGVYIRRSDIQPEPGLGDLILLSEKGSPYPLSAFVGDRISSPEGLVDLNNLFGSDSVTRDLKGGEKLILRIYRSGELSTLTHYRRTPTDENMVFVSEPNKGFFADINLDGAVDSSDFEELKKQYRTLPDDPGYNPDFDFVEDAEGKIDAREFSKFAKEYGRTNVEQGYE
jgi:hypothetical protein